MFLRLPEMQAGMQGRQEKLVIIGAGMATAELLSELVSSAYPGSIEVISEESMACYNRILLSSILAGVKSDEDISLLTEDWFRQHGIKLGTAERVVSVNFADNSLLTSRQRTCHFDKLVFATGSLPYKPSIPGIDTGNVLGFRNRDDLQDIASIAQQKPGACAVVIGGGLLGLEAAAGLNNLGLDVSVINRGPWLMQRQLDAMGGLVLQKYLQQQGINIHVNSAPARLLQQDGKVTAVQLKNAETLAADMVMVTAGIVPNIALAVANGLACDKGIRVNGLMQTSRKNVFALGECCELEGKLFGLIAPVRQQAKILAAALCGRKTGVFVSRDVPVHLKISGIDVVTAGPCEEQEGVESQVLLVKEKNIYRRLLFRNNQLLAYVLVGDARHSAWYDQLMESRQDIAAFRADLMFGSGTGDDMLRVRA